jgi:hypothetical protein
MSGPSVEAVARTLLYEGYLLYPYRRSAVKNRQRFNWGVLYPAGQGRARQNAEPWCMRTECLIRGLDLGVLEVTVRFLHLFERPPEAPDEAGWQEAVEREIVVPPVTLGELVGARALLPFDFPPADVPGRQARLEGQVLLSAEPVSHDAFRASVAVENLTAPGAAQCGRDELLLHSLVATHTVLRISGGEFISLTDPPAPLQQAAAACRNVGTWPVLAGDPASRDTMLSSPIIVSDYPAVAPESPGDFFDATEMDEMLSLRILSLTDEEKQEMRAAGDSARRLLERTEACTAEELMRLHGVMRPVRMLGEGS